MRNTNSTMIFWGLLIVGLNPLTLNAQTRPGKSSMQDSLHVDTRMLAHQQKAGLESMEEHPTAAKTGDVPAPVERKRDFRRDTREHAWTAQDPNAAAASTVAIQGNTGWSASNGTLTMQVDRVVNNGAGTTGSLRLRVWATQAAYRGGNLNGYVLGTYQFPQQLRPGQYYPDVNVNVPYTAPSNGTYYTSMTLEEYQGPGWYIISYVTYSSTTNFDSRSSGDSQLEFEGNVSWAINGGVLTIKADKVVNNGGGITGSLRLRLWATASAYAGGTIRGYVLGGYQFSRQLNPHEYFYAIDHDVQFVRPPDGTYHTTLTLEEYTSAGWTIRDYASFNSTTTFGAGTEDSDPCRFREINTFGDLVSGVLTSESCLNNGYRVDGYSFFAAAGSMIQIVMRSEEFYTLEALIGPNGDFVATVAEGWEDGQAVITITAPVSGQYRLLATSNNPAAGGPGALGRYVISVKVF